MGIKLRQVTTVFCIALLFVGSFVAYVPEVQADADDFPDVPSNHWAYPAISKMGLLSVVQGYLDGRFQPDQKVTQEEVLAMVLKTLELGEEAAMKAGQAARAGAPNYSPWAKGYVYEALDQGLISQEDSFHGPHPASRSWVAQVIIRMLDRGSEAQEYTTSPTSFTDDAQIPSAARGAVNLAMELGIISGFQDNTFRPRDTVTRSQMAMMLSQSIRHMDQAPSSVYNGKWMGTVNQKVTIQDGNDETQQFDLAPSVAYYKDNKLISSVVKNHTPVSLIVEDGAVVWVEIMGDPPSYIEREAKLVQVYPEQQTMILQFEGTSIYTTALLNQSVELIDSSNQSIGLSQLAAGDSLTIFITTDNRLARVVKQSAAPTSATVEGLIVDIQPEDQLLTISRESDQRILGYALSADVEIAYDGVRIPTLSQLAAGDKVKVTLKEGLVSKITLVVPNASSTQEGTIKQVSQDEAILTVETESGLKAFRVSVDVVVDIEGVRDASLYDLKVNDRVVLTLSNNLVSRIEVTNRKVVDLLLGTVEAVDTRNNLLVLKDEGENLHAYSISSAAQFDLDGTNNADIEDVRSGMKVEINLDANGNVIFVREKNTVSGTVKSIKNDNTLITIAAQDGKERSYVLSRSVDVISRGISSPSLWDVGAGDEVELRLSGDTVSEISLRASVGYIVEEVNVSRSRIEVIDKDDDQYNLTFDRNVELRIPGVERPTIQDIREDEAITATFMGDKLEKIEVFPTIYGNVSDVNTNDRVFTVELANGSKQSFAFTGSSTITSSANTYRSLASLPEDRHVAVQQRLDGVQVTILQPINASFYAYYSSGTLSFYETNNTSTLRNYRVTGNFFVHEDGQPIKPSALHRGDSITLYVLDKTIYEAEKR